MPNKWRLFLGVCGWGPSQLIGEIKGVAPWNHNMSWCTAEGLPDLVFDLDNREQWMASLDRSAYEFTQNVLT